MQKGLSNKNVHLLHTHTHTHTHKKSDELGKPCILFYFGKFTIKLFRKGLGCM